MECKIFYGSNRAELEKIVNAWLKEHMVSSATMHFHFSSVLIEDSSSYRIEHTLVLFFVPMYPVGR